MRDRLDGPGSTASPRGEGSACNFRKTKSKVKMKKKPVLINTSADESYSPALKRQCKVRVVDSVSKEVKNKRAAIGTACVPAIPFNSSGSSQSRLTTTVKGNRRLNPKASGRSCWTLALKET